jgi:small subunit ribosomal protein S5
MEDIKKKNKFPGRKPDEKSGDEAGGKKQFRKNRKPKRSEAVHDEFDQKIIDIARVTRVMAGGKRMRFRACVVIGNGKGTVAAGLAKGADVTIAVSKAVMQAKKELVTVPMVNETIPHEILCEFGSAKILFKPARKGRGVIAGGAVRAVLEIAGVKNVTSKILGTNNKVNNVKCTILALKSLKKANKKEKLQTVKEEGKIEEPSVEQKAE